MGFLGLIQGVQQLNLSLLFLFLKLHFFGIFYEQSCLRTLFLAVCLIESALEVLRYLGCLKYFLRLLVVLILVLFEYSLVLVFIEPNLLLHHIYGVLDKGNGLLIEVFMESIIEKSSNQLQLSHALLFVGELCFSTFVIFCELRNDLQIFYCLIFEQNLIGQVLLYFSCFLSQLSSLLLLLIPF